MAMRLSLEEDRVEETHEINVTPFIDVILVLLIIFMVAAPLSTVDVKVDLPASTAQPAPRPDKPVFVTVKADLSLALGDDPVSRETLAAALDAATRNDKEQRIFVRADRKVAYGDVMEMMNLLRAAGYLKIGLVGMEGRPPRAAPSRPTGPALSDQAVGAEAVTAAEAWFPARPPTEVANTVVQIRFCPPMTSRRCGAGCSPPLRSSLSMRRSSFGSCTSATCGRLGSRRR